MRFNDQAEAALDWAMDNFGALFMWGLILVLFAVFIWVGIIAVSELRRPVTVRVVASKSESVVTTLSFVAGKIAVPITHRVYTLRAVDGTRCDVDAPTFVARNPGELHACKWFKDF